ncbi:LysR family transcriptional regulator [Hwanghaeella grinnelliae]|nr:LysR family transcriptional regulator [Hwanghaeella grinnelliae]
MRFVLAIVREGTLSAAGRSLGVDQTTVTRRLAALEEGLNARLFDRRDGRLIPTPAGEEVITRAERAEVELAALERDVAGRDTKPGGLVRMTSVPTLSNRLLAPRVGLLFETYPDIDLDLIAEPATLSVTRREADIALRLTRPTEDGMIARRLGAIRYAPYARSDLADRVDGAEGRRGAGDADLAWITYEESFAAIPQAKWIAKEGKEPLSPLRVNDGEPILQAVLAGLGRSLLPVFVGEAEPGLTRLSDPVTSRDVWLVVHPHVRRSARIDAVVGWIDGIFAELKKAGAVA